MYTPAAMTDDHVLAEAPPVPPRLRSGEFAPLGNAATWANAPGLGRASRSRPQHLLDLSCTLVQARWGGIGLFSANGELIDHITTGLEEDIAIALGRSPAMLDFFARTLPAGSPLRGRGMIGGCSRERERPDERAQAEEPGVPGLPASDAFLALPLGHLGRYRGVLYVVRSPEAPPFTVEDEERLRPVCACLDQASLFEETHLLAQLRLLNQVIQAAAGKLDLKRILTVALRELDRHLPMHRGAVWLTDDEGENAAEAKRPPLEGPCPLLNGPLGPRFLVLQECSAAFSSGDDGLGLLRGTRLPLEETPFTSCARDGQALYVDLRRIEEHESPLARKFAQGGASAFFAVPMRVGEQTVGVLFSLCLRPGGFTGEQIQLLYLVADLLGPAISNCQMFNRLSAACEELRQTQGHLIQSEKMRALGELAGGMAHDFNNSLCGVLGFLELTLMEPTLSVAGRGYLESARACALDAAQSVSRVQDFARKRRNERESLSVDVNELARLTVELTRPKWENLANLRQAPIKAQVIAEAAATVRGNPGELRNALTNLVLNAVDAMPEGGTLTVHAWNTPRDAFVAIQDTGIGMDENMRQRIFEPFFSTKGERGTGLGLSAAFGIIERHEGEITVDSELGRGSTFTVRLPLAPALAIKAAPVEKPPPPSIQGLRILVVEDEESIRRFLGNALKQLGHHARLTSDGPSALAVFDEEMPDVVITDLGLPGLSGEEVARQIAERSPQTPVILLTGWADQIESERKTFAGVTCVLGKPVSLGKLTATLQKVCARPRSLAENP